ncbi:MAG TPA: hypothetical protein VMH39_03250, partial [Gemmatimonadaceae bacterium]|nr:hypothetical protein [Gemmatimonadaceae bacterium]
NNNATLTVTSGTLVNSSTGTISILQGTATGIPVRTLTAALNNQGVLTVFPGAAGTFTINGNLSNSGTIDLTIGGTASGSTYDLMQVNGGVSFTGGTLNVALVNGFTLGSGQNFFPISSTFELSGEFEVVNLPSPLQYQFNMNQLQLFTP